MVLILGLVLGLGLILDLGLVLILILVLGVVLVLVLGLGLGLGLVVSKLFFIFVLSVLFDIYHHEYELRTCFPAHPHTNIVLCFTYVPV